MPQAGCRIRIPVASVHLFPTGKAAGLSLRLISATGAAHFVSGVAWKDGVDHKAGRRRSGVLSFTKASLRVSHLEEAGAFERGSPAKLAIVSPGIRVGQEEEEKESVVVEVVAEVADKFFAGEPEASALDALLCLLEKLDVRTLGCMACVNRHCCNVILRERTALRHPPPPVVLGTLWCVWVP